MPAKDPEKRKEIQRRYRERNAIEIKTRHKEWRDARAETLRSNAAAYRDEHRDEIRENQRRYRERHKEKIRDADKLYRDQHKEECLVRLQKWRDSGKCAEYQRNKRQTDPQFQMAHRCYSRLHAAIKSANGTRSLSMIELIGCSPKRLIEHLESLFTTGMSWLNRDLWHIDHIVPCAAFDLTDPDQQRRCFHYTNLEPLWATDNLRKGSKCINRTVTLDLVHECH